MIPEINRDILISTEEMLKIFVRFGEIFYSTFKPKLENANKNLLNAFDMFPGTFFFHGRNDSLSEQYKTIARKKFSVYGIKKLINNPKFIEEPEVIIIGNKPIKRALNKRDRKMFKEMLEKMDDIENNNFVTYAINKIKEGKFKELLTEIIGNPATKKKNIYGAGPKTTSLFLRDVVIIFDLEACIKEDDYFMLFPIDTWVRKICKRLKLVRKNDNDKTIIQKIVRKCKELGIDPLLVNAGIWYVGKFSQEIAFNNLDKIKIKKYDDW